MFLTSSCNRLYPIHWSQVSSQVWRCSWSSADRRCSNYIWVINNFVAYQGATYIRGFTGYYRYVMDVFVAKTLGSISKFPSEIWGVYWTPHISLVNFLVQFLYVLLHLWQVIYYRVIVYCIISMLHQLVVTSLHAHENLMCKLRLLDNMTARS